MGHALEQLVLERLLNTAVDRQHQRLAPGRIIGEALIERALDAGDAMPVDVGVADDVRGKAGLRVEAVGFAVDRKAWLAERIDGFDQVRRGAPAEIEERRVRPEQREILVLGPLGHELGEAARDRQLIADDLAGMNRNRPSVDRPGQRLAVAIDDIAALGDESGEAYL